MNKKEINELAARYALMSDTEKKLFLKNEKKRIEALSPSENKSELITIKNILQDLKKDAKSISI